MTKEDLVKVLGKHTGRSLEELGSEYLSTIGTSHEKEKTVNSALVKCGLLVLGVPLRHHPLYIEKGDPEGFLVIDNTLQIKIRKPDHKVIAYLPYE